MRYASRLEAARSTVRYVALQLVAPLLLAGVSVGSRADSLYVICNPSVSLSATDLRDVFLGKKQFAGPIKLAPADNNSARAAFLEKVLNMNSAKYMTTWTKKSFRDGVNRPPVNASDAEALEYVRRERGGCSYIRTAPGPAVSVVAKF